MLVISSLVAPRRGRRKRGRHARLTGADPDPVELPATRATAVRAQRLDGEDEAKAWLAEITSDPEARDAFVAEALVLLNTALHAQRVATMDPFVNDLGSHGPVATRVGYGDGEELATGRWTKAVDAPPDPGKRVRRTEALRPQERLAAVLGGRERVGACETLVLRARQDVDAGRWREAALQLEPATRALLAEVGPGAPDDQLEDLDSIRGRATELGGLAEKALRGPLGTEATRSLEDTLELCERVLRRRQILG